MNAPMTMESQHPRWPSEELDWLAFCYVSGELLDDDRTAFEVRLADDQDACEAVARAVELMQAIVVAQSLGNPQLVTSVVSRGVINWRRRLAWMSMGATAALVLVAAWIQWAATKDLRAPPDGDRQKLAEVWSQTRETVRRIVQVETYDAPVTTESDDPQDAGLPSWLTAAVMNPGAGGEPDDDGPSTHDES